jgi:DNA-binding NtrC family response regulator
VLIVEDQENVAGAIELLLDLHGIASATAAGGAAALAALEAGGVDLVIQDMNFTPGEVSGAEGIALFRELRARDAELPVLLLTAWPSLETAVALVRDGASDYLEKPWDDERLLATVRNLLHVRRLARENRRLREARRRTRDELARRFDLRGMVYAGDAMHEIVALAVRVAAADVPVLITGPNGSGKELLAEVIHANSRRRHRSLVKVNVGALPDTLIEAELFGAEAGAFTGAERRRAGRFEAAAGGTILLDELASLSSAGQAKLLRVLQSGEFERLGSSEALRADVRVVAATNADLKAAVAAGGFREDLYFRLNVIELQMPPLAGRPDDVVALAEHFLAALASPGEPPRRFSAAARDALLRHDWPGNVRELRNRVQRALVLADGQEVTPEDLDLGAGAALVAPGALSGDEAAERGRIEAALVAASGVVAQAAAALGMSRQALYRRMERLGLTLERRLRP